MPPVLVIAGNELRQRFRDRSVLVLGFVAPLGIAALMSLAFRSAESFSFTGLRYTVNLTGTGNNLAVPYFEGGNFSVSDSTYGGPLPDANLQLLAVTTGAAVPEPATSAAVVGVVALTALGLARTMRRRTV